MKGRGRKTSVPSSVSSLAAQSAISGLKALDRRRDRGQEIDDAYLTKVSKAINPGSIARHQAEVAAAAQAKSRQVAGAILGTVACVLLVVAGMSLLGKSRYSVDGRVLLDRSPLANIEVRFLKSESEDPPIYTDPKSTSFRMKIIDRNLTNINMYAKTRR